MAPARPPRHGLAGRLGAARRRTLGAGGYSPVAADARAAACRSRPGDAGRHRQRCAARRGEGRRRPGRSADTDQPGDGVLAAGGDSDPAIPLRRAGERLRLHAICAPFSAAGVARVTVREPRVRVAAVARQRHHRLPPRVCCAATSNAAAACRAVDDGGRGLDVALAAESATRSSRIGGTGSGRNDSSVQTLARDGRRRSVTASALTPGETAAFGFVGTRPVLLLPGRLDAALAVLAAGRAGACWRGSPAA